MLYIKNKEMSLLSVLVMMVLFIQGQVFLSKPKLILDYKQGSFVPFFHDEFSIEKENSQIEDTTKNTGYFYSEIVRKKDDFGLAGLELELLGTAVGNTKDPIAFIKDLRVGKQGIYRLGSQIKGAQVIKIALGEVVLDVNGRKEILRLSRRALSWNSDSQGQAAIISVSADQVTVSRKGLFNQARNILNVLPALKFKPYYEANKVSGLMIEGIAQDSIIAAAGIQNKDVVRTVNNQKINTYQKALQVLSKVRNQSEINVDVLREGKVKNLRYRVIS
ncbi:MAG: PDZ domain-containing protein [Candidatus Omnitrophota bacterium]|nr:PDZ domain-containing protein [Candidatus Omnitrophota bacterium]